MLVKKLYIVLLSSFVHSKYLYFCDTETLELLSLLFALKFSYSFLDAGEWSAEVKDWYGRTLLRKVFNISLVDPDFGE